MQSPLASLLLLVFVISTFAAPPDKLSIEVTGNQTEIRLGNEPVPPVAGTRYRLRIEGSTDLKSWITKGELSPAGDIAFRLGVSRDAPYEFFRLRPEIEDTGAENNGAEVFGYDRI